MTWATERPRGGTPVAPTHLSVLDIDHTEGR